MDWFRWENKWGGVESVLGAGKLDRAGFGSDPRPLARLVQSVKGLFSFVSEDCLAPRNVLI